MKRRIEWKTILACFVVIALLVVFAGCTGTTSVTVMTTAERWEQEKGRFTLNGEIEEVSVKSLKAYRKEYKAQKEQDEFASRND